MASAKPASSDVAGQRPSDYEQPLSERMRTFLRLEFLYRQLVYNLGLDSDWSTRASIASLLEIMAILIRGDVRSDVHKELDSQILVLQKYKTEPAVDTGRLDTIIGNLVQCRGDIDGTGTNFLQPLKDSEFLSSIKHRSAIPGGTCEFDLPEYSHWLRQPRDRRNDDMEEWVQVIRPICDGVSEVMWLIRESARPEQKTAINGMYQHRMQKDLSCRLIRVSLAPGCTLFPEISGSQHRFTVRFLEWSSVRNRAVQTGHDVAFNLAVC